MIGVGALLSLGSMAHAEPAIISVGPAIIHPDSVVTVAGTKASDATVMVDIRPPGNDREALACTGTEAGSTSWSCSVPTSADRPFGSHEIRAIETLEGVSSTATVRFQVVPDAVGREAAPEPTPAPTSPPPPPPPPPTPEGKTATPIVAHRDSREYPRLDHRGEL